MCASKPCIVHQVVSINHVPDMILKKLALSEDHAIDFNFLILTYKCTPVTIDVNSL